MYKQALNVAASDAVDLDLHLSGLVELPPSALSALQGAMTSGELVSCFLFIQFARQHGVSKRSPRPF